MTKAVESWFVRWTEPRPTTPTGGPSDPGKSYVVLFFLQEPALILFIPFFLVGSGSEMFRQEIIYVSIFQRHFIVWERERGKRKSQYKNKSNLRSIFFLRLKNVYCSSYPFSPSSFTMLLRCPFQHNIFK